MWHSHLNDIEIPETKRFIPKGFELVTTLSKPNRPVSQFIRDAIGLLVSVKPSPIPRRSLLPRCPREVWKQPGLTQPRTPRDNAELSRNFMGYVKSVIAIGAFGYVFCHSYYDLLISIKLWLVQSFYRCASLYIVKVNMRCYLCGRSCEL